MRALRMCCYLPTVLLALASPGCSKDSSREPQPGASQGNEAPAAPATGTGPMTKLTDGQIVEIIGTVDTAEIEQAEVAQKKTSDPDVRAFATHMIEQHTAAKQTGAQLESQLSLKLDESPKSVDLRARGSATLDKLNTVDASSFDVTYVDSQIEQHAEVLTMIDQQLLPAVVQASVREHLNNARGMVQHHLEQARQLKK
jgi:putative membrane protein